MANSADADQLASKKPTDLDLHCLERQGISGFSMTRVKIFVFSLPTAPLNSLLDPLIEVELCYTCTKEKNKSPLSYM